MEPGSLYRRAREEMGWDFTAVTDHDIWSLAEEGPRSAEELEMMVRSADEAYRPGELVTFPAYEWTDHRLGHRNVLFGPGEEPAFLSVADVRYSTPALLIEALVGRNVLVIGHHPAWKTHAGEMRFDYGPPGGPARLIEVYSDHGNSEFYGAPRPPTHTALARGLRGKAIRAFMGTEHAGPDSGSYVRDAWAAGQRLGLIAGSDEHLVGVDPADGIGIVYSGGITALLATGATREAVWDALVARRAYATTGARMYIEFSVDGRPMGSEIACQRAPLVSGRVIGTCELELVEVVKYDGGRYSTAWSGSGEDDISFEFEDASCRGDCFYYLRVIQRDGELAWAGPVWVDEQAGRGDED